MSWPATPPPSTMKSSAAALRSPQRPPSSSRRKPAGSSLQLPSLPRFHPANFASPSSNSASVTPDTTLNSPQPPLSPRHQEQQQRRSEAQQRIYLYHQQLVSQGRAGAAMHKNSPSPTSPRLEPLGSPGPVTPFELEGEEDYLFAGAKGAAVSGSKEELLEGYIAKETRKGSRPNSRPHSRQSSRSDR